MFKAALYTVSGLANAGCSHTPFERMSRADQMAFLDNAITLIRQEYVDAIPTKDLLMGAVEGMLSRTDPHSSYMTADMSQKARQKLQGQIAGIGLELSMDNGFLGVISPLDGSPAARSGIQPGDRIVAVNGLSVETFPMLSKAIQAIQGPVGSSVDLLVERKGHVKPLPFHIRRQMVDVAPVRWKKIGPVGYIRLSNFNEKTAPLLEKALTALPKEKGGFYGYVIDLRNNPGGLVQQALRCCDFFINKGPIVFTKGRTGPYQSYQHATPKTTLFNKVPCVVLINQGSASASEIMAGALQAYKAAIVVGTQSFGKGSVQNMLPLSRRQDLGEIKLTIARFYTPLKRPIQGHGIQPDVTIEQMPIAHASLSKPRLREEDLPGSLKKEPLAHEKRISDTSVRHQDDYQLFSAITILKTLWLEKNKK